MCIECTMLPTCKACSRQLEGAAQIPHIQSHIVQDGMKQLRHGRYWPCASILQHLSPSSQIRLLSEAAVILSCTDLEAWVI